MNVVLLHALPFDARMWEPQRAGLNGHALVTPDLYSLGSSTQEWAEGVLRQAPDEFAVLGASMGGYCALQVARLAPERVRGVGLLGSRPEADPPERRPVREEWLRLVREQGAHGLWEAMRASAYAGVAPQTAEQLEAIALEQAPEGLAAAVTAIRDRPDSREVVAALEVPFLLVVGDSDPLVPVDAAPGIVAAAPDGELLVVDRAGHVPSFEQPEVVNAALTRFLGRL